MNHKKQIIRVYRNRRDAGLKSPRSRTRTNLKEIFDLGEIHSGIYVVAYLGKVVYVGKAEVGVQPRLRQHICRAGVGNETLGDWMIKNMDHANIRVDVLEGSGRRWLEAAEHALIQRFSPLLNVKV